MLLVSQVNQAIIAAPGVGMDDSFQIHFTAYNALLLLLGAIGNDFDIDHTSSLENMENRGFTIGSTAPFPFDSPGTKVKIRQLLFRLEKERTARNIRQSWSLSEANIG